jgi:hypothetical protein
MRTTPDSRLHIPSASRLASAVILLLACSACAGGDDRGTGGDLPQDYGFGRVAFTTAADPTVHTAAVGRLALTLHNPDVAERPTVWEGPLEIRAASRTCIAPLELITDVYVDSPHTTALVVSYSGAATYVDFIDTAACNGRWPQIEAFTDSVRVSGDRLTIHSACVGDASRSQCFATQVYTLAPTMPPALRDEESRSLTKAELGVEFTGDAYVAEPRTANARLLERE